MDSLFSQRTNEIIYLGSWSCKHQPTTVNSPDHGQKWSYASLTLLQWWSEAILLLCAFLFRILTQAFHPWLISSWRNSALFTLCRLSSYSSPNKHPHLSVTVVSLSFTPHPLILFTFSSLRITHSSSSSTNTVTCLLRFFFLVWVHQQNCCWWDEPVCAQQIWAFKLDSYSSISEWK